MGFRCLEYHRNFAFCPTFSIRLQPVARRLSPCLTWGWTLESGSKSWAPWKPRAVVLFRWSRVCIMYVYIYFVYLYRLHISLQFWCWLDKFRVHRDFLWVRFSSLGLQDPNFCWSRLDLTFLSGNSDFFRVWSQRWLPLELKWSQI